MKFRALTYTIDINKCIDEKYIAEHLKKIAAIKDDIEHKVIVRTSRLNAKVISVHEFLRLGPVLEQLTNPLQGSPVRWLCVGIEISEDDYCNFKSLEKAIISFLDRFPFLFINVTHSEDTRINEDGLLGVACIIRNIAIKSGSGYNNFRFGYFSRAIYGVPFFPFSIGKHEGDYSIAVEVTQQYVSRLHLEKSRQNLDLFTCEDTKTLREIQVTAFDSFQGFDFSFAPYPEENISVGEVYCISDEFRNFGSHGSVKTTSSLTRKIRDYANDNGLKMSGFNGVMLSVLEDKVLSELMVADKFQISDLYLNSTVCGCGIDMFPVSGFKTESEIALLLSDLDELAFRLEKPLGFRILPITGKVVGDFTDFSMQYICNSQIKV
jgi:uncharacterized protein